jgi:predicted transcriptional regulator
MYHTVIQKGGHMPRLSSDPIAVRLPADVLASIDAIAATSDRSRSWVILRALRLYLASEGSDILALSQARNSMAKNTGEEIDDVIADVERIIAGKPVKAA